MDRNILYVDSARKAREKFKDKVSETGSLSAKTADSPGDASRILGEGDYKCVVADSGFEPEQFNELISEASSSGVPIILFSNEEFGDIDPEISMSVQAFVSRKGDYSFSDLVDEIESLLEDRSKLDYPVPEDEEQRLESVDRYQVEELAESGDFDRLTRLGAEFFGTRWCFVGIIDSERERFLSFYGSETKELERRCTICTFTINREEAMVVDDREKDPRFKYVDELDDLGIKWYAGVPIRDEEGLNVGAFCVMDDETRDFSADEREILELLAEEASEKLELKRKNSESLMERLRRYFWQ